MTLLSSIQNLGQKLMQLWMEINVVTLHKIVETTIATANALRNQSKRPFAKGECATVLLDGQFIFGIYQTNPY